MTLVRVAKDSMGILDVTAGNCAIGVDAIGVELII